MFQKGRPDLLKNLSGAKTKSKEASEEPKVKPQPIVGVPQLHQFHPMPAALMQRTVVNHNAMSEYNPLSSNNPPYLAAMPVSNSIAVNPILLEQHQQYLEQQRFQQQRALLAQLRGPPQPQQAVSMQDLQLLRAQNADRVRMLQQLQQQQQFQQQQQRNTFARPPM
jgi:hypothetical protein